MPDPDHLIIAGAAGVLLGILSFIYFLYTRIRRMLRLGAQKTVPGIWASLRRLTFIMFWTSCSGILLFAGAFLQSYRAFTYERPVAEIHVTPMGKARRGPATFVRFSTFSPPAHRYFLIAGDQWMLEGDILKWDNRLIFLGLQNRYRFTRLRGRYASAEAERRGPHSVLSLNSGKTGALWRFFYAMGARLPFVSTVYGNAVFQDAREDKIYQVYVGVSGFVVREGKERRHGRRRDLATKPSMMESTDR
jgi:hypothetical protein